MDRKKIDIITLIAIIVIIFGLLRCYGIFISIQSIMRVKYKDPMCHYVLGYMKSLPGLFFIPAGLGLLFRYHWARISTVVLLVYDIAIYSQYIFGVLLGLIIFPFAIIKQGGLTSWDIALLPYVILILAFFILHVLFIYYLTRPKVKAQFARQESSLKSD